MEHMCFSSPEPKDHTHAPESMSSVRPLTTISKLFFSEIAGTIKLKLYVEPPWVRGMKVGSRNPGHMTKMATTPIYGNQRTNGPVNAHLRSAILTKYLFKKIALYGAPPTNQNKGLGQKSTKL